MNMRQCDLAVSLLTTGEEEGRYILVANNIVHYDVKVPFGTIIHYGKVHIF